MISSKNSIAGYQKGLALAKLYSEEGRPDSGVVIKKRAGQQDYRRSQQFAVHNFATRPPWPSISIIPFSFRIAIL